MRRFRALGAGPHRPRSRWRGRPRAIAATARLDRPRPTREQQTDLQADIVRPEGRTCFAGEHCELYHAWIQGALESGIRAAREIHERPA